MENLNSILKKYVAEGDDTANKLVGAAFIVCNKDGTVCQNPVQQGRATTPNQRQAYCTKGQQAGPA